MRVVLLGLYPRDKNRIGGGVQAVTWYLASNLAKLPDVEVHAVMPTPDVRLPEQAECQGVHEHYLPLHWTLGGLTLYAADRREVQRELREIRPDIVHVHGSLFYPTLIMGYPAPSLMTVHGLFLKEAREAIGVRAKVRSYLMGVSYEIWALRKAQDIVVISDYVEGMIRPYTRARLHRIDNPIEEAYFDLPNSEVPGTILFAGAIIARKGVMFLLQAMSLLKERGCTSKLHLVGPSREPEYERELRRFYDERGLQDVVEWEGLVPEERLRELYSQCSLLVLPSREESSPIAIGQAMAVGKPVVGTRAGGIPYLVQDGRTGLLAEYGNAADLAEKLHALLEDQEKRTAMGKAAREEAEARFRGSAVARKHLELYSDILERGR